MKRSILRIVLILAIPLSIAFYSCNDKVNDQTGTPHDPTQEVKITWFDPDSGRVRNMVLIDGVNFGNDPEIIKVFFNHMEAKVVGAEKNGTRILALVPRLPGDECLIKVYVGAKRVEDAEGGYHYEGGKYADTKKLPPFRYKMAANVTTVAGNGSNDKVLNQGLDKAQFWPVYIGMDKDDNIFVTTSGGSDEFLRINVAQNVLQILGTYPQHLLHNQCPPNVHPYTNVVMCGANGNNPKLRFIFLDPRDGWAPKPQYIRSWKLYPEATQPTYTNSVTGQENVVYQSYSEPSDETHYCCIWSIYPERPDDAEKTDENKTGWYYTRYNSGQIVRVDPLTWEATVIGMTPAGCTYSIVFHPIRPWEMWLGAGSEGDMAPWQNSLVTLDVRDYGFEDIIDAGTGARRRGIMSSAKRVSSPFVAGGHRDGLLSEAQFKRIRQLGFDHDGNLYVGDCENYCLRMVTTMSDPVMVSTVIGVPGKNGWKDGSPDEALFRQVHGIVTDKEGIVYLSDWNNGRIRRIAIE